MNKLLKITLAVTGLVVGLLVAVVLYVANLDPNNHKARIADQFRQQTGRELTLGGDIGLTLYPWLGISLRDVAISNAPGFGDQPMLVADTAEVRIKLLPILSQHYEIDTVKLYGASVNLAVNADGLSNWADLTAGTDDTAAAAPETGGSGFPLGNIILGGVDVQNANLSYSDAAAGTRYDISNLTFKTDALVYGQPIDLNMTLQAAANIPALTADMVVSGTLYYDLDNGRYELAPLNLTTRLNGANLPGGAADIVLNTAVKADLNADTLSIADLTLTALGSELQASVEGENVSSPRAVFKSSLNVSGTDLALLFKAAEIEPLATQLAGLSNRAFDLATELTFDSGRGTADIPALRANLLGTTVTGALQAAEMQTATPSLQGTLQASGPDLPTLVEVLGQVSGGRNSALSQAGRDLRQVSSKSFAVDTEFDANLRTGNVEVPTLDLRLLGATVNGNLSASNIQTDTPQVKGKLAAAGPDLPLLMQIAGRFQGVDSALFLNAEKLASLNSKAFSVNADFDADMETGNISVPTFDAAALGINVTGDISMRDFSGRNGTLNGNLNLTGDNLRGLLSALDQQDLGEVVQSVSLQGSITGSRSDLSVGPLTFNAVLSGNRIPNSPVTVTFTSSGKANLDQESLVVDNFALSGLGLNATGNLNASSILDTPAFTGELNVASFNLRRLLQQLNQTLPAMADPSTLETVSLGTSFDGSTTHIKLDNLAIVLDQSTLNGSLALSNATTTDVNFDLVISELDADRYLAPATEPTATTTVSDASTELPLEMLRSLNMNGKLAVGKLTLSGLQVADLSLGVNADGGDILVSPMAMNLYQGSFAGSVGLNAVGPQALATVEANLQGVALEPLMVDFMDATYVSGTGNVQFSVNARGNDTGALKTSLSGTGKIALEDGVLKGVDVAGVLGQVETMLRSRRVAELQRGQQTAFESFGATFTMTNGVVASNDLLIKSPGIQITGSGTLVDLNTDAIAYNMVTSVDKSTATRDTTQYDIGGYSVPIACTGTLNSPRCLPDAGEIARTALAREAERRVGDLIQRTLGTGTQEPAQPAADATPSPTTEPATTDQTPAPADPASQLINRALNRILN